MPEILLRLDNISLSFGEFPLLDDVNLQIEARERIFLVGRNGMGKSCLLKVIHQELLPDEGKIFRSPELKIATLPQTLPNFDSKMTVYDLVSEGLADIGFLLKEYHLLSQISVGQLTSHAKEQWLNDLDAIQKRLEEKGGWLYQQKIDNILTRLGLPRDELMVNLSGGWQRRVLLAKAIVSDPDILLLDEPTNHLDISAIEWLENFLLQFQGAILCITHDRAILNKLAQRIIELDRGKLTSFLGSYEQYLMDKEKRLQVELNQSKLFDNVLAREETWIRQGIKARRTRNEGRVRALKKLREERKRRREIQSNSKFSINEALLSGELVIKAENIYYSIDDKILVKDFSMNILRNDKIVLVGPNGCGKTTVLKLLLGQLPPQSGKVQLGTRLNIAYFDQLRAGIDPNLSVMENVGQGRETINIHGKEKHVISFLADFLFTPERARTPVSFLSGGECNRLLLAKLFSLPTNFLVLDEPTNDLDIESLELLEEILSDYQGTIMLVSHDRSFIDRIATSVLFFAGHGKIIEYVGGYKDIPMHMREKKPTDLLEGDIKNIDKIDKIDIIGNIESIDKIKGVTKKEKRGDDTKENKFDSKMKRELEKLLLEIPKLEERQKELQLEIMAPDFYERDKKTIKNSLNELSMLEANLEKKYARWEELENLKKL